MLDGLFIASLIGSCVQAIKEACEPTIPAENWANKDLYHKDLMSGMDSKQLMRNVQNGRYKLIEKHPEPHRDPISGKIIIENCKLYDEDLMRYGAVQTMEWVKQGRYNLSPEKLKKEQERIKAHLEYLYSL